MAEHSEVLRPDLEVCPSCGAFATLDENTGWCANCSRQPVTKKDYDKKNYNRWMEVNRSRIEELRRNGLTLHQARDRVRRESQPRCITCGRVMERGSPTKAKFCRITRRCWRAYYQYNRLKKKGVPEQAALEQVREKYG